MTVVTELKTKYKWTKIDFKWQNVCTTLKFDNDCQLTYMAVPV